MLPRGDIRCQSTPRLRVTLDLIDLACIYSCMLRVIQNSNASGAKSYYSLSDYYTEDQELPGVWRGKAAERLGLTGEIDQKDWEKLCDNMNPATGERLTQRQREDRRVGYDFNFHVPKSVSLLYGLTQDERILKAFQSSVNATMNDIESEIQTRVRRGGKDEDRTTGNMVWGEYTHFTSRPVNSLIDPHLHAHCFVLNTTFDAEEDRFKAAQFKGVKRDASYFEAVFHSRLADRLGELGLPIERHAKGWELEGVSRETLKKFSLRTEQIEELANKKGITDPKKKDAIGATSRSKKSKSVTFKELQKEWKERLTESEAETLNGLVAKIGSGRSTRKSQKAKEGVEHAIKHVFERNSVVPERQLLATALKATVGEATFDEVLNEARAKDLIQATYDGRTLVTTPEVLQEEQRVLAMAREGRGTMAPINADYKEFQRDWLNDSQKNAVRHILSSRNRITMVRGVAGVGKTTLVKEAAEAMEREGVKVFAFAPSSEASRDVLRKEGFEEAETVATLLINEDLQQRIQGQCIWVDEAGLIGTPTMGKIFELAERVDARVLLTGDKAQHQSVERGNILRQLEEEAGLVSTEVREIQRQRGQFKAAVKALSEQRVLDGFNELDAMGWVKEVESETRYKLMAADFVDSYTKGFSSLCIAPTHKEGARINDEIREHLQSLGRISKDEVTFTVLENTRLTEAERADKVNYQPGEQLIQFHRAAKGVKTGQRFDVSDLKQLPLDHADRFQLFNKRKKNFAVGDRIRITNNGKTADGKHALNNGNMYTIGAINEKGNIVLKENGWEIERDFGHFTHGYVVTSFAAQGKSVDHVFIGQSSDSFAASSNQQFYVSVSRGKRNATIYTHSKSELAEAIQKSEERLTASELMQEALRRKMLEDHEIESSTSIRPLQVRRAYG